MAAFPFAAFLVVLVLPLGYCGVVARGLAGATGECVSPCVVQGHSSDAQVL